MRNVARVRILPLLALVLAAGCSDLGLDPRADEVVGLTIEDSAGNTLVTVASSGSVTGSLSVPRAQQRSFRIVLRGAGGVVTPGVGEIVRVTVTNSQVAHWLGNPQGEGTITGGPAAGTTTLRVDLISGGTAVYTSPSITVTVT